MEVNRTEIVSLYGFFDRIKNVPMSYTTASKIVQLMCVVPQNELKAIQEELQTNGPSEVITNWFNEPLQVGNIIFTEEELDQIKVTPLEAHVLKKFTQTTS